MTDDTLRAALERLQYIADALATQPAEDACRHGYVAGTFCSECPNDLAAALATQPAERRVQVYDGDGELTLEVELADPHAQRLSDFLDGLDMGDVYNDPIARAYVEGETKP